MYAYISVYISIQIFKYLNIIEYLVGKIKAISPIHEIRNQRG